jgi:hypothetical protein
MTEVSYPSDKLSLEVVITNNSGLGLYVIFDVSYVNEAGRSFHSSFYPVFTPKHSHATYVVNTWGPLAKIGSDRYKITSCSFSVAEGATKFEFGTNPVLKTAKCD